MRERRGVRIFRGAFGWWPFPRGRGRILRLARLLFGDDSLLFDIGGGTFLDGPLQDWGVVWTFLRAHEHDAPFQRSIELVRPGGVVIDAGANLGIWSLLAAKRGGLVHAFEPVPTMVERLQKHLALNDARTIVVNELALAAECATRPFYAVMEKNTGASSLSPRRPDGVELRVTVVTLDAYLERQSIDRVDLLKVDVEGAELLLFRGAHRLLSSDLAPIIFFEIDERLCAAFGFTCREVKQFLADRGYGIYRSNGTAFVAVPIDLSHGHEDLFALKPRHLAQMVPAP